MKSKPFLITTIVLLFGIVVESYFLFDLSKQKTGLGNQLTQTGDQLIKSEDQVSKLTEEKSQLTKEVNNHLNSIESLQSDYDVLQSNLNNLQSTFDDLYNFTFCGDEFVELEMNYNSDAKADEALYNWVDEMWGNVLGSDWTYFWTKDGPVLEIVTTGYANDYFVVYFEQQKFYDAPSGVFLVSHHCWLDGGPESLVP